MKAIEATLKQHMKMSRKNKTVEGRTKFHCSLPSVEIKAENSIKKEFRKESFES